MVEMGFDRCGPGREGGREGGREVGREGRGQKDEA